jgi:hypothetical protein
MKKMALIKQLRFCFAFLCFLPIATFSNENNGAYQFVLNLYSNYKKPDIYLMGKGADTIFAPDLLKLIRLDEKLAKGEVGCIEADPICDCQDSEGLTVKQIKISKGKGVTHADVKYKISETNLSLRLELLNIKEKWYIIDIISSNGQKKISLYNFLLKCTNIKDAESIYHQSK